MMSGLIYKPSIFGTFDFRLSDGHCMVNGAIGDDWFTVYLIQTDQGHEGKGEASRLMTELKRRCDKNGRVMRVWCPMSEKIVHICEKLGIEMTSLDDELDRREMEVKSEKSD